MFVLPPFLLGAPSIKSTLLLLLFVTPIIQFFLLRYMAPTTGIWKIIGTIFFIMVLVPICLVPFWFMSDIIFVLLARLFDYNISELYKTYLVFHFIVTSLLVTAIQSVIARSWIPKLHASYVRWFLAVNVIIVGMSMVTIYITSPNLLVFL